MQVGTIIDIAAGLAQPGEPLWTLIRDAIIPDDEDRKLMLRQAFRWEMTAGAARKQDDVDEARKLRTFLKTAPAGISLNVGLTIEDDGEVSAWPNPFLASSRELSAVA